MATVIDYLLDRLSKLGVTDIFGVPGDYAFSLNDAIIARKDIRWIGCANELNAAYAADGYARMKGVGVVNTTFGVGELSAINAVAGAYAEYLPVIHLVGMPDRKTIKAGRLVHHTLGNGQFKTFFETARHIVCAQTILDGQNCVEELDRVLTIMQKERRPVYIGISTDAAFDEVILSKNPKPVPPEEKKDSARQVAQRIIDEISQSKQPCVLPGTIIKRFGCHQELITFLHKSNLPFATMFADKAIMDEQSPNFIGMYCGQLVQKNVADFVEKSDLVFLMGAQLTDFNTGMFSSKLVDHQLISLTPEGVKFRDNTFYNVKMTDVMSALATLVQKPLSKIVQGYLGDDLPTRQKDETTHGTIRNHTLYSAILASLRHGDIVIGETGSISTGVGFVRFPEDVNYEGQNLWGSIGWATPAAFGMAIAAPEKRIILLTGEGAHQMTAQALGEFARFNCHPLIILLNNEGYLIERLLCKEGENYYNDIASWDYIMLARGFGCKDWQCARVTTPQALQNALEEANSSNKRGIYLEVVTPRYEAPPMAKALGNHQ